MQSDHPRLGLFYNTHSASIMGRILNIHIMLKSFLLLLNNIKNYQDERLLFHWQTNENNCFAFV